MPRTCTICSHPDRVAIDKALVAGTPIPRITALYRDTSEDALLRHKAAHLPAVLARAQHQQEAAHAAKLAEQAAAREQQEQAHAIDIAKQLRAINAVSLSILDEARRSSNPAIALKAIDRVQRQIELQAKLLGELDDRPQIDIVLTPEWLTARATLLAALAPYPDARVAVAERLLSLEASPQTGAPNGHRG
jgi:hypothetical protein